MSVASTISVVVARVKARVAVATEIKPIVAEDLNAVAAAKISAVVVMVMPAAAFFEMFVLAFKFLDFRMVVKQKCDNQKHACVVVKAKFV